MTRLETRTAAISRRLFARLLLAAPLAIATSIPVFAETPAEDPLPASLRHDQAVTLLRRGRTFEKAAGFLEEAVQKEPEVPSHQLALGCAYACRAASLAYAAMFTEYLKLVQIDYDKQLKRWEDQRLKLQVQGTLPPDYDKSKPRTPPSPPFPTKDDGIPYRLTPQEVSAKLNELNVKALAAWETGITLAKTPEEKGQAFYLKGWGMRLLRKYFSQLASTAGPSEGAAPSFSLKNIPTRPALLKVFDAAIESAPDNPLYWQAKADALADIQYEKEGDTGTRVLEAYRKAAEFKPENAAAIWYQLYDMTIQASKASSKDNWEEAEGYLQKAQTRDRGNAWPLYEEAVVLFRRAPFSLIGPSESPDATTEQKKAHRDAVHTPLARQQGRRAIDLIQEGNIQPSYIRPIYSDSVPVWLTVAWNYGITFPREFDIARLRDLARAGTGYMTFLQENNNDTTEAARAGEAVIGMGMKIIGDWPVKDDLQSGKTILQAFSGIAITAMGYKALIQLYGRTGNADAKAAAQAQSDAFNATSDKYRLAVREQLRETGDFPPY